MLSCAFGLMISSSAPPDMLQRYPMYLFFSALFQPDIPLFPWSDLTYQEQLDLYPGVLNGRSNLAAYPMFLYIVHPYFYFKYLRTSRPLMSGIIKSKRIKSNLFSAAISRAILPPSAKKIFE